MFCIPALAHYARCFSSGKRNTGLSDSVVKQHAPEYLGLHQWMRNMRNKHMAHDENPYQNFVGSVFIQRAPTGHVFAVPNVAARGTIGVDADRARAIRELITRVGDVVKERLAEARKAFVTALAKLPLRELESLPVVDLRVPTIEDAGRGRDEWGRPS